MVFWADLTFGSVANDHFIASITIASRGFGPRYGTFWTFNTFGTVGHVHEIAGGASFTIARVEIPVMSYWAGTEGLIRI